MREGVVREGVAREGGDVTGTPRFGFDTDLAGKRAECDGGYAVVGTHFAGRQEFAGTLTGEYVDHGDPPWRWYVLTDFTHKPESYTDETVWCESGNLFIAEEEKVAGTTREERGEV